MRYANKTKDTFGRGWAINRIVDRLRLCGIDLAQAGVLYLAGEAYDRKTLLKRGFREENLCAVDTDAGAVRCVRDAGGMAIQDKLVHLLLCWPTDLPMHAVLADYNCGFDEHVAHLIWALLSPGLADGAQVYINLQRGRDEVRRVFDWNKVVKVVGKNRAKAFIRLMCGILVQTRTDNWTEDQAIEFVHSRMAPILAAPYRAHSVYMDGAVFTVPIRMPEPFVDEWRHPASPMWKWTRHWDVKTTGRKIAAWRAVRTARLRRL
jgi:hypothetical protein